MAIVLHQERNDLRKVNNNNNNNAKFYFFSCKDLVKDRCINIAEVLKT